MQTQDKGKKKRRGRGRGRGKGKWKGERESIVKSKHGKTTFFEVLYADDAAGTCTEMGVGVHWNFPQTLLEESRTDTSQALLTLSLLFFVFVNYSCSHVWGFPNETKLLYAGWGM